MNHYRVWQPLGLTTLAALTPTDWDITIFDENVRAPDYEALPAPDLVGITAFTSQANRAYDVATIFRRRGVPVIMGGIHATMCPDEAGRYVDSVVTGEAEQVWKTALTDFGQADWRPDTREHTPIWQRSPWPGTTCWAGTMHSVPSKRRAVAH